MDRIFIPMQVKALMPSDLYKVLDALFAFQKEGTISYSKRNAEFLHLDQAVADQCIQTAVDYKLITPIEQSGGVWKFRINGAAFEAAKMTPLSEIPNKQLLRLSSEITFKNQTSTKEMSPEELLRQIDELKRKLMEKVQPAKENNASDGLPW